MCAIIRVGEELQADIPEKMEMTDSFNSTYPAQETRYNGFGGSSKSLVWVALNRLTLKWQCFVKYKQLNCQSLDS